MSLKKPLMLVMFLILPAALAVPSLYGACCGEEQFKTRANGCCPNANCNWERGDNKCNTDSDCCPGRECNSFGNCQDCR